MIVFTTKADLKVETKTDVVWTTKLIKTIKKYNQECLTDEQKEMIFQKLCSKNVNSYKNMREHVRSVRSNKLKENK